MVARILVLQQSLLIRLSLWSVFSVFAGGMIALLTPARSFWSAFGGMTAGWGLVNLTIASFGFYGIMKKIRSGLQDEQKEILNLLRLLKLNVFLDVGYVAVGAGLVHWGKTPLLQGFGWAIVLQGMFLLLLDGWYYYRGGKR